MRFAILTSSLPPHSIGGAEIQAHATAIGLAKRGHSITVFARAVSGERPGTNRENGVTWVRTGGAISRLGFPGHVLSFLNAWRNRGSGFDGILAYQTVIPGLLGVLKQNRDLPLATWIRSEDEIDLARVRKYRVLTPWVLARSHRILVQSRRMGEILQRELTAARGPGFAQRIAARTQVLGNAVTITPQTDGAVDRHLVFVGRLVEFKGLDILFAALRMMETPPRVVIHGDGPLRHQLEDASRDLPVEFRGAAPPERVREFLTGARALVAPSRSEGFPNAVLEAMERGVPPVATRVGGIPDVVENHVNGLLVDPEDPAALAAAIRRILDDDPLREQLSRNARVTAESHGWDAHLTRLESVLVRDE